MKQSFLILIYSFLLLSFASCTIQKRLYSNGWHIEKKHHYSKTNEAVSSDEILVSNKNQVLITDSAFAENPNFLVTKEEKIEESTVASLITTESKKEHTYIDTDTPKEQIENLTKNNTTIEDEKPERVRKQFSPSGKRVLIHLLFSIICLLLMLIGILSLGFISYSAEGIIGFLATAFFILAFILLLRAMYFLPANGRERRANPNKYKKGIVPLFFLSLLFELAITFLGLILAVGNAL